MGVCALVVNTNLELRVNELEERIKDIVKKLAENNIFIDGRIG